MSSLLVQQAVPKHALSFARGRKPREEGRGWSRALWPSEEKGKLEVGHPLSMMCCPPCRGSRAMLRMGSEWLGRLV